MAHSTEDKKLLFELIKKTIESELFNTKISSELLDSVKKFDIKKGVFVTLTKNNELRGCIGQIMAIMPEYEAIIEATKSAAFNDPRFPPINKTELPFLSIEISLLTPLDLLKVKKSEDYLKLIKIGKHGIFIESKNTSGLLLPQVFTEYKVDVLEALQMTCQKAGLHINAWKDLNNKIYIFEAEIFNNKK